MVVPNSAVKTSGRFSYVEIFTTPLTLVRGTTATPSPVEPTQKRVETGVSNDTLVEIVSGLKDGEQVVTRTISTGTTKPTTAAPSLFGNTGTRGLGGTGGTRPSGTGGAAGSAARTN